MFARMLFATFVFLLAFGREARAHDITQEEVDELIEQLGAEEYETRVQAMERLIREARESVANTRLIDARLRAIGVTSADAEIAARSRGTIEDITIQGLDKRCLVQRDGDYLLILSFTVFDSDGIREIRATITDVDGFVETVVLVRYLGETPETAAVDQELERSDATMSVTITVEDARGDSVNLDPPLVCVPDSVEGLAFPAAVRGGGNFTELVLVQGSEGSSERPVTITFWSPAGDILETRSVRLAPNSTSTVLSDDPGSVQGGHVEVFAENTVVATQVVNLFIPGVGDVPPIGISPAGACRRPAANLKRNAFIDTGLALSNRGHETAYCDWSIYAGPDGAFVSSGSTAVPALGQTQSFPLEAVSPAAGAVESGLADFDGNIQFDCDRPVHAFSLFQRRADGAIFSNAVGCLQSPPAGPPVVDLRIKGLSIAFIPDTQEYEIVPTVSASFGERTETEVQIPLEILYRFPNGGQRVDARHRIPRLPAENPCRLSCEGQQADCVLPAGRRCEEVRVESSDQSENVPGECNLLPARTDDHGRVSRALCVCTYWFSFWETRFPGPQSGVAAGTNVVLVIDPNNLVPEVDENNNTFVFTVPAIIAPGETN